MKIELSAQAQKDAVGSIQRYFEVNMPEMIGELPAGMLLNFFLEEIGPAIYTGFLPAALAAGAYRAAPDASVVGDGLASIPAALQQLRDGVSATKLVVTV